MPPRLSAALLLAASLAPTALAAQGVVGAFAGSVEKGSYQVDYDALPLPDSIARDAGYERIEGALFSRVLVKPDDKSNLEVFRSYERELRAGGFTVHFAATPSQELKWLMWKLYRAPHIPLAERTYRATGGRVSQSDLARIASFADYYLAASRTAGGETLWVSLIVSKEQNLYLVEELTTTAMETGTVTFDLDRMRDEIERSGKIAVYDIHFATGSAAIEPASADALAVIASYLRETRGGFYIVGHTDDTGGLDANLDLSRARAAAVKDALVTGHGIDDRRLETRGVGPLAPVSTNAGEGGRALNRRVEIVQRLGG